MDERRYTLIMLSRLGSGDGGRETWLSNFLAEIAKNHPRVAFDIVHSLPHGRPYILDSKELGVVVRHVTTMKRSWRRIRAPFEFMMRCVALGLLGKGVRDDADRVVAVGGLSEAIATVGMTIWGGSKKSRVLWLRTIYSKEKAARTPSRLRPLLLKLEIFVIRRFYGLVIANGEDTAEFYRGQGLQVDVVPNSIPISMWRMSLPKLERPLKVGFIGRLSGIKGAEAFLDAVDLSHERGVSSKFCFVIAGVGPQETRVRQMVEAGRLEYRGGLSNKEVVALVGELDCCVALTFLTEDQGGGGVSNALLEQMAAGRVIVAWKNNIFTKVLSDSSAYLVEQGNANDLLDKLIGIADAPKRALLRAGEAATIVNKFSIESHVSRFLELTRPSSR